MSFDLADVLDLSLCSTPLQQPQDVALQSMVYTGEVNSTPTHWPLPPAQEEQVSSAAVASFVPYKRVLKACTQCRRDKTRCDRGRPCSGCEKKGRAHSCRDECLACKKGSLKCDQSRPCAACREHERDCVEQDPDASSPRSEKSKEEQPIFPLISIPSPALQPKLQLQPDPQPLASNPVLENGVKLTRACVCCRRDNKKCEGGTPCPRCAQRNLSCTYAARAPKLIKQRCAMCRQKNKKCEEARPCELCVKARVECYDLPRKGRGHGLRVKRACAGCRTDKIQCEEARPCAACKRKKVECKERQCAICIRIGVRCDICQRHAAFQQAKEADMLQRDSGSEDEGQGPSTPSVPSPPTPPDCSGSLVDPHFHDKSAPPQSHLMHSEPSYVHTTYLQDPNFYTFQAQPDFPSTPSASAHPMRPSYPSQSFTYEHYVFYSTGSLVQLSPAESMRDL